MVFENVWQVERDKQSSSEQSCAEGDLFKFDLGVQGVPQNAVLEDQERVTKTQDLVHMLGTQHRTESVIRQENAIHSVKTRKRPHPKLGKIETFELGVVFTKNAVPVPRQVLARRTVALHLRNMSKAFEGTVAQDKRSSQLIAHDSDSLMSIDFSYTATRKDRERYENIFTLGENGQGASGESTSETFAIPTTTS